MNLLDWGFIAGVAGICAAAACLYLLRKQGVSVERRHEEMTTVNRQHWNECSGRIDELERNIGVLEVSAQNIEHLGWTGLTRSRRSEAMQLLRSGISPDSAAVNLGIARREMRLMSKVSNILSLQ